MPPSLVSASLAFCIVLAWTAPCFGSEPLRLRLQASDTQDFEDFRVEDGRLQVRNDDDWIAAPLRAVWSVSGSFRDNAEVLFAVPPHFLRSVDPGPGDTDKVSLNIAITDDEFASRWPAFRDRLDAILVGVWIRNDVAVVAQGVLRPRRGLRAVLDGEQLEGFPALLLWSGGQFIAPEKTFEDEAANRYLFESIFDSTESAATVVGTIRAPDKRGREGRSLLHLLAQCGPAWSVRELLARDARVNARSDDGSTALMFAAYGRRSENLKALIDGGAELDARNKSGYTALRQAIYTRSRAAFQILLDAGASWNVPRSKPESLATALNENDPWYLRQLIQNGARDELIKRFPKALSQAAHVHNPTMVRVLLEVGFDPAGARQSFSPIHEAVRESPFHDDVRGSSDELLKLLLEYGADPNALDEQGQSPLLKAVERRDAEQTRILLNAGADLEIRDAAGNTALTTALRNEDPEITGILASAGARLDLSGNQIDDAIARLLRWDVEELLQRAISDGWDPHQPIHGIWSPLHLADWYGARRSAALLKDFPSASEAEVLDAGEKPDVPPRPGQISMPQDPRSDKNQDLSKEVLPVHFIIDDSGRVRFPRVDGETDERLARAVFLSLPKWRFLPAESNGKPVNLRVLLPVTFPASEATYNINQVDKLPELLSAVRFTPSFNPTPIRTSPGTAVADVTFVVEKDGSVSFVRSLAPGGPGFEREIVDTIEAYKFLPGEIDGEPVRVKMSMLLHIGKENRPKL